MQEGHALAAIRRFVREHERGLIVTWLAGLVIVLCVAFIWGIVFRGAERVVDAWEARWPARVDLGAQLIAQKRFTEAANQLELLDAEFPAKDVVHRFDRERERLLTLLIQSYVALDRKKRALAACERLVAFDPRNWQNHWTQAQTALTFGESGLAKQALDALLTIHPTHLPGVEARIRLAFDAGAFAQVPTLWIAYADAYRLAPIDFSFAGATLRLEVKSDGLPQRFEVAFPLPENSHGEARFDTHGWSIDVREVVFVPSLRAGMVKDRQVFTLPRGKWIVDAGVELDAGQLCAASTSSSLRREISGPDDGAARAAFELVAYKACSETLWAMVSTSYRNLLLWDELESQRARTRVGGCLEAGTFYDD